MCNKEELVGKVVGTTGMINKAPMDAFDTILDTITASLKKAGVAATGPA